MYSPQTCSTAECNDMYFICSQHVSLVEEIVSLWVLLKSERFV